MEALAAVALAGNILQFVETGFKVVKWTKEILNSKDGATSVVQHLAASADSLGALVERIVKQSHTAADLPSQQVQSLLALARQCTSVLLTVQPLIDDLRQVGRPSWFKAAVQAGKILRHKQTITEVQSMLMDYRSQISTLTLDLVLEQQRNMSQELSQLSKDSQSRYTGSVGMLHTVSGNVEQIANRLSRLDLNHEMLAPLAASSDKPASKASHARLSTADLARAVAEHIQSLVQLKELRARQQSIVDSLWFETISVRYEQIQEAHKKTYEWALTDERVGFHPWLKSGTGLFWVSGKAGCGKSTLMKLICEHEATRSILTKWGAGRPVITAQFYFWRFGNEMQKSLHGLLRSLLFEVLDAMPALIPILVPARWQNGFQDKTHDDEGQRTVQGILSARTWTLNELEKALLLCPEQRELPLKMCLFIDGLDEYEGNHRHTISLLQKLAGSADLKICVASRPENIFQKAFGSRAERYLMLHELTREDIKEYVTTKLHEDDLFLEACERDHDYRSFVPDILRKAEGVFLWVHLAVYSLLDGLADGDSIAENKRRLDELPLELENLFQVMIQSVEPRNKKQADEIFRFCLLSKNPLPLLAVPHIIDISPAIWTNEESYSKEAVQAKITDARRRLNARCRGLMEAKFHESESQEGAVRESQLQALLLQPIHRTVWEFLENQLLSDADTQHYRESHFEEHRQAGLQRLLKTLISCDFHSKPGLRKACKDILRLFVSTGAYPRYTQKALFDPFKVVRDLRLRIFDFDWHDYSTGSARISELIAPISYSERAFINMQKQDTILWHTYFTFIMSNDAFGQEAPWCFPHDDNEVLYSFSTILQAFCLINFYGYTNPLCSLIETFVRRDGTDLLEETPCTVLFSEATSLPTYGKYKMTASGASNVDSSLQLLAKLDLARVLMLLCPNKERLPNSVFPTTGYLRLLEHFLSTGQPFRKSAYSQGGVDDAWKVDILWIKGTICQATKFQALYGDCSNILPSALQLYLTHGADPNKHLSHRISPTDSNTYKINKEDLDTPWLLFLHWIATEHAAKREQITGIFSEEQSENHSNMPGKNPKQQVHHNHVNTYEVNERRTDTKASKLLLRPWLEVIKAFMRAGAECQTDLRQYPDFRKVTVYDMGASDTRAKVTGLHLIQSWTSRADFTEVQALMPSADLEACRPKKKPRRR